MLERYTDIDTYYIYFRQQKKRKSESKITGLGKQKRRVRKKKKASQSVYRVCFRAGNNARPTKQIDTQTFVRASVRPRIKI